LSINYLSAQTEVCDDLFSDGKTEFEAGKYKEAKATFGQGLKLKCDETKFQSWIKKCDEKLKENQKPKAESKPTRSDNVSEPKPAPAKIVAEQKPAQVENVPEQKPAQVENSSESKQPVSLDHVIILPEFGSLVLYPSDFKFNNKVEAIAKCKLFSKAKVFGCDHWRIPTKDELQLIYIHRERIAGIEENAKYLYDNEENAKIVFNKNKETVVDNTSFYLRMVCNGKVDAAESVSHASVAPTTVEAQEKPAIVQTPPPPPMEVLDISACLAMLDKAINASPTSAWESGNVYKGQKDDNGRNGLGIFYYKNTGDFYIGGFKNNNREGTGIYIKKGDSYCKYYAGEWSANNKSGTGTCYENTGALNYHGDFNDGDLAGKRYNTRNGYKFGIINYPGGDKYIGEISDGKADGYGIYLWSDGDMWYGQWKSNKRAGRGMIVNYNADLITGTWDGDTYVSD
jgi:hypothetical protein